MASDSILEVTICETVKMLHDYLLKDTPRMSTENDLFKATRGWFNKFNQSGGIHSIVSHGEAASSNKVGANNFRTEFQEYIEAKGFVPQQVVRQASAGRKCQRGPISHKSHCQDTSL